MIRMNNFKFLILLFPVIFILSCCKRSKGPKKHVVDNIKKIESIEQTGNITIFVHGTHTAAMNRIFKPFISVPNRIVSVNSLSNMHYMKNIAYTLSRSDADFSLQDFYIYGWSGKLDPKERENGAKVLYLEIQKLIEEYKKKNIEPKISILTHSHGGNVALNLAKFNEDNSFYIDRLILLAVPVQEMTSQFTKDSFFKKIYSFSSSLDLLQIGDPQALYEESKKNKNCPLFSKRFFKPQDNLRQAKIKINDRAIFHIEFIMERFIKFIPALIKQLDSLDQSLYLMKLSGDKNIKTIKFIKTC